MMEYIFLGILTGLLILWILNIHGKLNETCKQLDRIKLVLSCKEQWELTKYETEKAKEFYKKEHEFIKLSDYQILSNKIQKLEEKCK